MDEIDPNCKECHGFGWHPTTVRLGFTIPGKFVYTPCQSCNTIYRKNVENY